MSGRGKRVLVCAAALLLSPAPSTPFERGAREFALSLVAGSVIYLLRA